jgi:hydroxyquinol 1,2-dioxygenase
VVVVTGLSDRVAATFDGSWNPRFAEVMRSLVAHLHEFIAEVSLTEEEWAAAIDFLTRTGHRSDDRRQEFILLSDVLGASMAVVDVNHPTGGTATESTVLGPFFVEGAPEFPNGADIAGDAPGEPCWFTGTVISANGTPVAGAVVDVWQSDETGNYDVQYPDLTEPRGRGRLRTDDSGTFSFWSVRPEPYPIPHDGPVGELLRAAGRGPMRPAHLHFKIAAPNHRTLITHVFPSGDDYLATDAVFGVKPSLVIDFARTGDAHHATFTFTLAPTP